MPNLDDIPDMTYNPVLVLSKAEEEDSSAEKKLEHIALHLHLLTKPQKFMYMLLCYNCSQREMSYKMGVSIRAVERLKKRTRKRLREILLLPSLFNPIPNIQQDTKSK